VIKEAKVRAGILSYHTKSDVRKTHPSADFRHKLCEKYALTISSRHHAV